MMEITHHPSDREVLHLLVERQWLQQMQVSMEDMIRRLEAKIDKLEKRRAAKK